MQEFTRHQVRVLKKNPNVEKITEKHICYTPAFIRSAVEKYYSGISPDKIFEDAGLNVSYFKKRYTDTCIKRWNKKYKKHGKESLGIRVASPKGYGRPKNLQNLSNEELQAVVEAQKEIIKELKKKRALAREKSQ